MKIILSIMLISMSNISIAQTSKTDSQNSNRFAFSMMNVLSRLDNTNNIVYSPYGLRNCFLYAYAGTANSTKQQIQNAFFFPDDLTKEFKAYQYSNTMFNAFQQSKIRIANSMWIKQNVYIKPSYSGLTRKYTDDVRELKTAIEVNAWVSQKTNGEINELVSQGEVNQSSAMLLNALALDAQWKNPFKKEDTYSGDFYIGGGQTIGVPTMRGEVFGNYFEDRTMKIVKLPYKDDLSMTVIMPLQENFVLELDENMQKRLMEEEDMFGDLRLWSNEYKFSLHLPKFELSNTLDMVPALKKLGVIEAFDSDKADFSEINNLMYIELVRQIAKVEVMETGTKASAATVIGMVERGGPPPTYKIDRPFYFIVHHSKTGEILFMGQVRKP